MRKLSWTVMLLLLGGGQAHGDDGSDESATLTAIGVSIGAGGGGVGFVRDRIRSAVDPGAAWAVRMAAGTRRRWGVELAYLASVHDIASPGLDDGAVLRSRAVEAVFRVHFVDVAPWQPYGLFGAGWRRYAIHDAAFNRSRMADRFDGAELPLGLGLGFRHRGLVLDARAVLRIAADSDLMRPVDGAETRGTDLHTLGVEAGVGWEF